MSARAARDDPATDASTTEGLIAEYDAERPARRLSVLDHSGAGRFFVDVSFAAFRRSRSAPKTDPVPLHDGAKRYFG